jgi:acyl dehydratase
MTLDLDTLLGWPVPTVRETLRDTDLILYALGVGLGRRPDDPAELRFLYEEGLRMLPSMASVLAHPGLWMAAPELGIDWRRLLHGAQGVRIHAPLPTSGEVVGTTRVTDVVDRGPGKGALIYQTREIHDGEGGHLATATITTFARGDGGCGGTRDDTPKPHVLPERPADLRESLTTIPQIHLIYRLLGDRHPIHVDPDFARSLGFEGPILAGLCTYGIAGHALLRRVCPDPGRLAALEARFSAPAYPGETIETEIWDEGEGVYGFRARAVERDAVVLDNGRAEVTA